MKSLLQGFFLRLNEVLLRVCTFVQYGIIFSTAIATLSITQLVLTDAQYRTLFSLELLSGVTWACNIFNLPAKALFKGNAIFSERPSSMLPGLILAFRNQENSYREVFQARGKKKGKNGRGPDQISKIHQGYLILDTGCLASLAM